MNQTTNRKIENNSVVEAGNEKTETSGAAKRLLDLDDIKTAELKLLSPTIEEIAAS